MDVKELAKWRRRYDSHRSRAKVRGIGWEFDFPSWLAIWAPYRDEYGGPPKTRLNMCRTLDRGSYSPENVYIAPAYQNQNDRRLHGLYNGCRNGRTVGDTTVRVGFADVVSTASRHMARGAERLLLLREQNRELGIDENGNDL